MNDLHKNLLYVKDLVTAMGNLNREEQKLLGEKKVPVQAQRITVNKVKRNRGSFFGILLLIFILLFLFNAAPYAINRYRSEKTQIELEKADDKFSWNLNHPNQGKYPGYQGSEKVNWVSVLLPPFIRGFIIAGILTGIVAAIISVVRKRQDADVDKKNRMLQMNHETVLKNNEIILQKNAEIDEKIKQIANRRALISQEYMQNIIEWYPKDYGYPTAVDFFINLVENHLATSIQECVEQYNTHLFRQEVTDNQQEMLDNQSVMIDNQAVMIDNQEIMISKQDKMIKAQMFGNAIAAVNMMANITTAGNTADIANSARSIERNTAQTAQNTASIAGSAASTARHVGNIDRSLRS